VSYRAAAIRSERIAHGLMARGVGKGEAVAIIGRTTLEWALVDYALAQIGAVSAPVYPTSSDDDVHHVVSHSRSVLVICEDDAQAAKVDRLRERLPLVRDVIRFADLAALESEGDAHAAEHPNAVDEATHDLADDDLYTLIYTSGTTGRSKGCMIRHRNYFAMAESILATREFEVEHGRETLLVYLPFAHNFGRLMLSSGPMCGAALALEPDPYRVAEALTAVRPTIFPSVPRVYEKIHGLVESAFADATGARARLIRWALEIGRKASSHRARGATLPVGLRARHAVASRLVYAKVKARLGGRLRLPISGGAPLAPEIGRFFDALDIPIYEGYGLTEATSAATVNRPGAVRYGSVGQPLPGVEVALADDGELLVRGEIVFAGYFDDPEGTAAVLRDDGWVMTGDVASIDADGFVTITDRKKDIIITAGGKNIAPQNIENELKLCRYVSQALVVGDRRPYAVALVTLDPAEIVPWAKERGLGDDLAALAKHPDVRGLVQDAVDEVNRHLSRFEQIKRFAILPRDFEMASDEVTPTLKLRRRICIEHFAETVDRLYAEADDRAPGRDEHERDEQADRHDGRRDRDRSRHAG